MQGAPRRKPATSVDVARAAGVSQTTVSLVFSGRAGGRVSERTRALVERIAAELGYAPNTSARVLRGGRPKVLALAVPNVRNEYFSAVLVGGEQAAREQGVAVLLMDTSDEAAWVERMIDMERAGVFAGAIVYAQPPEVTARLAAEIEHVVFVECPDPHGKPSIDLDLAGGLRQVVEHLRALGHRRIGHARADLPRETFRLRAAHLAAELGAQPPHFASGFDVDVATGRAVEFLRANDVTAIFCDDDLLAGAVYRAAHRLERWIPGELSVIGFNDVALARYLMPELTSVAIPAETVGALAVRALLDNTGGALVPLTLTVRASTAAPR